MNIATNTSTPTARRVKILADSSADLLALSRVPFASVPLKIITDKKEYVDDDRLSVERMVNDLKVYKGRSSTSCPNAEDWLAAFGDAEDIYCVTITGTLSGSYNAAVTAKELYEEAHPDRRVFVFNSLSAGAELKLILEKIEEWVVSGMDFEEICKATVAYKQRTGLVFMLESMRNLANNGRVSPVVAKVAGLIGIRVVGKASDKGDLEPMEKCKGQAKAITALLEHMTKLGYEGGRVTIAHCFNAECGTRLKDLIKEKFPKAFVSIYPCRGLCSFYAEAGGLLVGFEKARTAAL